MHSLPETRQIRKTPIVKAALLTIGAALLILLVPGTLHASPITYDLTLTPGAGSTVGGTGSFTIEGAPVSSGISDYTFAQNNLYSLSFTLAGQTFTSPGDGTLLVEFLNGSLRDITFSQELGKGTDNRFSLHTTDRYDFAYNNELSQSIGTFTATQAPASSPVPEPASLLLFTTGLLGGAAMLYRRMTPQCVS
ncbi:MAG: PEP-CTERM sorting domain-containing protein [Edaphobacter sp.]